MILKDAFSSLFAISCALFMACSAVAQEQQRLTDNVAHDEQSAVFVYTDVENFHTAYDNIQNGGNAIDVFQTEYIDRGSPGLKIFVEKYNLTAERLAAAVEMYVDDYARIGDVLEALREEETNYKIAYGNIKAIIPNAVFPPTYFVIGAHRGIGSGSIEGPLITIEKDSVASVRSGLVATIVHEMIHMEQLAAQQERYFEIFSGEKRTLLALSIREGGAMFFSDLITGGSEHKSAAWEYLLENEADVWKRYEKEMNGYETSDWLWETPSDPGMPQDVGYAIGARITQFYYEKAEDKGVAAAEIMAVTDYPAFLKTSGYPNWEK